MASNVNDGQPVRVLLVDDDRGDYLITRDLLADIPTASFQLNWIPKYEDALETICRGGYDIYLIDYQLGDRTGLELLREVQARNCTGPMILLTGQGATSVDRAAMEAGAVDFLEKDRLDPILLERSIRFALQQKRSEAELERKVQERTEELARANDALREADRRKDEFLATLAHELRNPLAPIRNALAIMQLAPHNLPAIEQSRKVMDRQVNHMVRLIDDLLDVSRISRGKLSLRLEPLEISDVLTTAIETSQPLIDKADLTLSVSVPTTPLKVFGDRMRLSQVFANLLNNSAKYTERGGTILLGAERTDSQVTVCVKDNGVGIPAEVLPQVFEMFTQVNRSLNRAQGGLGIGLTLVRRIVELHNGTVEAHSEGVGTGSQFTVRLPVNAG